MSDNSPMEIPAGSSISDLTELVRHFCDNRNWGQFHSVRNLTLSLVGEVGELAAEFQWIQDENIDEELRAPGKRHAVGSELADVLTYLLLLADVIDVDLETALREKVTLNEVRYPIDKSSGSKEKYTTYE
jgi:NTP pyrophosphatase (non-canonical NTP hydrolase)